MALSGEQVALVDLLDRVLDKGACVAGDIALSVAGVDLVYLSLRSVLASAGSAFASQVAPGLATSQPPELCDGPRSPGAPPAPGAWGGEAGENNGYDALRPTGTSRPLSTGRRNGVAEPAPQAGAPLHRLDTSPERAERGLVQLVLTVVELLRQLMERQALRRAESGTLTARQEEALGLGLMRLSEKMEELKGYFGLADDDLNINLGPLGDLLPRGGQFR
jgi:hypothetical protein